MQEEETQNYNPFGKPGSGAQNLGGAARHWNQLNAGPTDSQVKLNKNRLQVQQDENIKTAELKKSPRSHVVHASKKPDPVYNPWGKGSGNPRFNDKGDVDVRYGMKTHYDIFNRPLQATVKKTKKVDRSKVNFLFIIPCFLLCFYG